MIEFEIYNVKYDRSFFEVEIEFVKNSKLYSKGERKKFSFPTGDGWNFIYPNGTPKFVRQIANILRDEEEAVILNNEEEESLLQTERNKIYTVSDTIKRGEREIKETETKERVVLE